MNLLAQELKLPTPPTTNDPVTWIAIALVLVLVALVFWQQRQCAQERREERVSRESGLAKFETAMQSQRDHDAERTAGLHKRFDCVTEDLTEIRTRVAN